jgi:hypothetical protein
MSKTYKVKRRGLAVLAAFSAVAAIAAVFVAGASADGRNADGSFCSHAVSGSPFPPALCIQLMSDGQAVQGFFGSPGQASLRPGNYWLTVTDNSPGHNFVLRGPDGLDTEITTVAEGSPGSLVTRTDKIHLGEGSYTLLCTSTAAVSGTVFANHAEAGMKIDIDVGGVGQVG